MKLNNISFSFQFTVVTHSLNAILLLGDAALNSLVNASVILVLQVLIENIIKDIVY